jgi:deoxyribodipyrimidine photo-lyase
MTHEDRSLEAVVVWFRRDLRVADHPALTEAVRSARSVIPLFVLDERLMAEAAPARGWYLRRALAELSASLRERGSGLLIRAGAPWRVVAEVARSFDAGTVLATRDVTPYSHRRDRDVTAALAREGRVLRLQGGSLLVEPESIATSTGTPYGVFTPFWRALQGLPRRSLSPAPESIPTPSGVREAVFDVMLEPAPLPGLPIPGEAAAHERLDAWVRSGLAAYGADRDVLAGEATSHLGADLHFGTLSPLQVESAALDAQVDATAYVRQLAWREFYHHLLFHQRLGPQTPSSPLMAAFRREEDDPEAVAAWREGRTGVPVVDAGMRQLAATGWLSNRARLVVASFLTRHLLMDYRIGERHFMRQLIDGDVANNRGGWTWTAGVGADAQPWFRIFNPVRQGQRFDPDGAWVRRWVPELRDVADRHVHAPWEAPTPPAGYPSPIVDLAEGRARALAAFRAATG